MRLIKWNSDIFGVGHPGMDRQHKMWISIINNLYDTLSGNDAVLESGDILNDMLDYTRLHFSAEENLMISVDYPHYKQHKLAHERFINKLNRLQKDVNANKDVLGSDINDLLKSWLKNWLVDHIINMDKQYSSYLSGKSKPDQI